MDIWFYFQPIIKSELFHQFILGDVVLPDVFWLLLLIIFLKWLPSDHIGFTVMLLLLSVKLQLCLPSLPSYTLGVAFWWKYPDTKCF